MSLPEGGATRCITEKQRSGRWQEGHIGCRGTGGTVGEAEEETSPVRSTHRCSNVSGHSSAPCSTLCHTHHEMTLSLPSLGSSPIHRGAQLSLVKTMESLNNPRCPYFRGQEGPQETVKNTQKSCQAGSSFPGHRSSRHCRERQGLLLGNLCKVPSEHITPGLPRTAKDLI